MPNLVKNSTPRLVVKGWCTDRLPHLALVWVFPNNFGCQKGSANQCRHLYDSGLSVTGTGLDFQAKICNLLQSWSRLASTPGFGLGFPNNFGCQTGGANQRQHLYDSGLSVTGTGLDFQGKICNLLQSCFQTRSGPDIRTDWALADRLDCPSRCSKCNKTSQWINCFDSQNRLYVLTLQNLRHNADDAAYWLPHPSMTHVGD